MVVTVAFTSQGSQAENVVTSPYQGMPGPGHLGGQAMACRSQRQVYSLGLFPHPAISFFSLFSMMKFY